MLVTTRSIDVPLPDGQVSARLQDLQFHCSDESSLVKGALQDAKLSFLAVVETASVPTYLINGSALEVYTSDEATEELVFELLTRNDVDPVDAGHYESSLGLLLQVASAVGGRDPVEHLLLYAASSPPSSAPAVPTSGLVTPPRSSSPALPSAPEEAGCVKVYAVALRSESAFHAALSALSPPSSPTQAHFLDPFPTRKPPAKRPRLDSVLSAHTSRQSTSGRGVAKLMAGLDRPLSTSFGTLPTSEAEPTTLQARKRAKAAAPGLSRSHTVGHIPAPGTLLHRRSGSLHRVASLASAPANGRAGSRPPSSGVGGGSGRNSPVPRASPAPTDSRPGTREGEGAGAVGLDVQNKNVLSRCVMAGMRLWGHVQVKNKLDAEARLRNDEYKALYHQTFKAASFALRRRAAEPLAPERVREVVEKLLDLFCADSEGVARVEGAA